MTACFPPVLTSPSSSKVWRLLQGRWQCWLTELWTPFRWAHTLQSWLCRIITSTAAVLTPSDRVCSGSIWILLKGLHLNETEVLLQDTPHCWLALVCLSYMNTHQRERPNLSPDHCRHLLTVFEFLWGLSFYFQEHWEECKACFQNRSAFCLN